MEKQILNEMATVANEKENLGYILVIHTNDHNPAHIHAYKSREDISTENYYTRILIPKNRPETINDIETYKNDVELTNSEKKIILKWFNQVNKIFGSINYLVCKGLWNIYQDK